LRLLGLFDRKGCDKPYLKTWQKNEGQFISLNTVTKKKKKKRNHPTRPIGRV